MKTIKISFLSCLAILFTTGLFAQRGWGNNRQYNRGYSHSRSHISVNMGSRFGYRPAPVYGYRPAYRPVYRSRGSYVHFGPAFGFRLNVLPFGYSRIYAGGNPYYYHDGVYYRNNNNSSYEVVAPPLNATVSRLPYNAALTVIDGQKYYQVGGTFYQEEFNGTGKTSYRVVGTGGVIDTANNINASDEQQLNAYDQAIPTIGSRYDELPADSRVQIINQQKYFASPGAVYYKEVIEGDKLRYEVTTVQ
jgi:Family of unknown function (DUF6515)